MSPVCFFLGRGSQVQSQGCSFKVLGSLNPVFQSCSREIATSDKVYDSDGIAAVTDCGVVPILSSRGQRPLTGQICQIYTLFFGLRCLQNKFLFFCCETGVCTCASVWFCISVRVRPKPPPPFFFSDFQFVFLFFLENVRGILLVQRVQDHGWVACLFQNTLQLLTSQREKVFAL